MNRSAERWYLRLLSLLICPLIAMPPAIAGQVGGVTIQIVDGNRVQNVLSEKSAKPVSVRLVDGTGRPLENAQVQFVAPDFGPGGAFLTAADPVTVTTNAEGMAVSPPFQPNTTEGTYEIQVIASYLGQVSRVLVEQSNVTKKKSSRKIIIISAVAAGAAAAAFAAKGGGNDPSQTRTPRAPTTPPSIVFVNTTVGAPQ